MKEQGRRGRIKYTYGGVVFIYDPLSKQEITSWKSSDVSLKTSGTKVAPPVILEKKSGTETSFERKLLRAKFQTELFDQKEKWTSHSVLVVDMSGSMRRDDVNGARCRSDGVWMALARDYVQKPLQAKQRSRTDLISVIVMRDTSEVLLLCEPTDWFLYNQLIEMREWQKLRPSGPGNYMPAIEAAESLLNLNTNGACALSLLFFSDGVPSDKNEDHRGRCGQLASKFGRRLSITCVGMADGNEKFDTLRGIVEEAGSFGSVASFGKPSLDADSLSNIISTLASSLTTTMTEMTELNSGNSKAVRMDVEREKKGTPDDLYLTADWRTYHAQDVGTFWIWDYERDNFVELFDHRCHYCEKDTRVAGGGIILKTEARMCPQCHGACFCSYKCFMLGSRQHYEGGGHLRSCSEIKRKMMCGDITMRPLPSYSVSVKRQVFGEGAERMVRKFRFLAEDNQFVGIKYVAKDSRFVEDKVRLVLLIFLTLYAIQAYLVLLRILLL